MDEKTEELRDIFMDVSDEETVTESQADDRGSLATDEGDADDRLQAAIERMRDRYEFATDLDDDALVTLVREFYDGADAAAIADALGVDADAVFEARMDLHLVTDDDADAPFDLAAFRERVAEDATDAALADEFDLDEATARRFRRVAETQTAARRVSYRFRSAFEDALPDAALSRRLTESARQDGLEEATEDIDSLADDADVSF